MDENELERYRHGYEKAAEYYNLFANNEDLPFYLDFAKKNGSPILDLAAGTGRVSLHLAREGFEVVALERSPAMILEFKKQLTNEDIDISNRVKLIETDMREFSLGMQFPLIIIPTSFGHALTTDDQLAVLDCVYKHLLDDGIFIVDLFPGGNQPEYSRFEEPAVEIGNGKSVSRSGILKSNPVKQLLTLTLTFTVSDAKTGEVLEEIHQESGIALIYNREFSLLLRQTRLEIVEEFGDFDKSQYTATSGRRILLVRKMKL